MRLFHFFVRTGRTVGMVGCALGLGAWSASLAVAGEFPKPPASFDWSGFYIGGNVGSAWTNHDISGYHSTVDVGQQLFLFEGRPRARVSDAPTPNEPVFGSALSSFSSSGDKNGGSDISVTGGGQIGYQMQFGHFVVGLEGAFSGVSTSSNIAQSNGSSRTFFGESNRPLGFNGFVNSAETTEISMRQAETNWTGYGSARLGYAMGPFLFYGTGGVSFAGVTVHAADTANTDFFGFQPMVGDPNGGQQGEGFIGSIRNRYQGEDDSVLVGYTAGGGLEYAVTSNCSMGFEYRHNGFGSHNFHFSSSQGPVFPGNTSVRSDSDQLTFRVNFWLGHLGH